MPADDRIIIAGMGLVTPLGASCWSTMRALLDGRTIFDRLALAEPDINPEQLAISIGAVALGRRAPYDPTVGLAERAAVEAAHDAKLEMSELREAPLIVASGHGALQAQRNGLVIGGERFDWTPHEYMLDRIMKRLGAQSYGMAHSGDIAGLRALEHARRLLLDDRHERVVVIGAEACLTDEYIGSLRDSEEIPPINPEDYRARPLDRSSRGWAPSEMAAALILERATPAAEVDDPDQLLRRALSTRGAGIELIDVFVPKSDANGSEVAVDLAQALEEVADHVARQDSVAPIDLIHPHATGHAANDSIEVNRLSQRLGEASTSRSGSRRLYALKGAIGYAPGASGIVSLAIAALVGRAGWAPPMPWVREALDSPLKIDPISGEGYWPRHAIIEAGPTGAAGAAMIHVQGARNRRGKGDGA